MIHSCFIRCISAAIGAILVAAPVLAQDQLPDLGDRSSTVISGIEEEQLGREFMRDARRQLKFVEEPELLAYLNNLGRRLVAASDASNQTFHFYMVQDPTLNAFAVPGGHVTVHTGLITSARNEGELAAVLGHEIAHVTQRHMPRMFDKMQQQNLPALAGIIAAILLGGQAGQAALIATNAKLVENQLRYSREFEREADAIGIRALAKTGFDPRAMPAFFERLEQWGRVQDSDAPEFLRTHPLTADRIADSLSRAESYPKPPPPNQSEFLHIQAKIRALYGDDPENSVRAFAANLRDHRFDSEAAERYGYVIALTAAGRYSDARTESDRLIADFPGTLRYIVARGQIEVAAEHPGDALVWFERARKIDPDSDLLDIYQANAQLKAGRYSEARTLLRRAIRRAPNAPRLYELLARAEGETGNNLEAHQALAESFHLRGNLAEAMRHLVLARRYTGDSFYAQASLEAKIQAVRREMELYDQRPAPTQKLSPANGAVQQNP